MKTNSNVIKTALIAVIFSVLAITVPGCASAQPTGSVTAPTAPAPAAALTWTLATQRGIGDHMENITYGNGRFVATGRRGSGSRTKMAYSTDGITWTAVDTSVFGGGLYNIAYGGGRFVGVGSYRGVLADGTLINPEGRIVYSNLQE